MKRYDLPPFEKIAASKAKDTVRPPEGTVYNYPMRKQHNAQFHLAHMPALPEIAAQIYSRGALPTMLAKLRLGASIDEVIGRSRTAMEDFI